jgi:hypothetical protein
MLVGVLAILNGAFWLWLVFCFATMVDPSLEGWDWWRAVFEGILRGGRDAIAFGLLSLAAGVWLILSGRTDKSPRP